jgi:hypothetical protein
VASVLQQHETSEGNMEMLRTNSSCVTLVLDQLVVVLLLVVIYYYICFFLLIIDWFK